MRKRASKRISFALAAVLSVGGTLVLVNSCGGWHPFKFGPDFECSPRPDDPSGYLQPICRHIADAFDSYPIDPNTLEIEQVISGAEQNFFGLPQYSTDEYDFVRLNCCGPGDWAVLHIESKKVVLLLLGDY